MGLAHTDFDGNDSIDNVQTLSRVMKLGGHQVPITVGTFSGQQAIGFNETVGPSNAPYIIGSTVLFLSMGEHCYAISMEPTIDGQHHQSCCNYVRLRYMEIRNGSSCFLEYWT